MRNAGPECTWHRNALRHRNPKLEEFERGEQRGRGGEEEEEEEGGRVFGRHSSVLTGAKHGKLD